MANKLKKYRVDAGLTQAKLAKITGVTQSTYQRWETGQIPIPDGKIERLAAVLDKTPDAALGLRKPVEAALYDAEAPDFAQYYGEVAFHFKDGGDPLLLSISEKAYGQFHQDLQGDDKFFIVQSLSNQTIIIRSASVANVYFSSEAYDYYGPKDQVYLRNSPLQLPDSGDWEIIEAIAHDVSDRFKSSHNGHTDPLRSALSDKKSSADAGMHHGIGKFRGFTDKKPLVGRQAPQQEGAHCPSEHSHRSSSRGQRASIV